MKKATIVVLAVMLMAGVASAQVGFGVGGGISKMTGEGSEYIKLGYNGRVTAFKAINENMHVGFMGAYNMFSIDEDEFADMFGGELLGVDYELDVSASIIELLPSIRYFMTPQFFIQAGAGLYMWKISGDVTVSAYGQEFSESMDESESKAGVSIGGGMSFGKASILALYNIIFTEEESTKFFSVNAMIGLN